MVAVPKPVPVVPTKCVGAPASEVNLDIGGICFAESAVPEPVPVALTKLVAAQTDKL